MADRLQSIFKNDRADFEAKWDDLKIFIYYGMLTQEDFYSKAEKFALLKDTDNKHYTHEGDHGKADIGGYHHLPALDLVQQSHFWIYIEKNEKS